jgi:hypothetical protein
MSFVSPTLKSFEKWRSPFLVLHATSMTKFYLTVYYFKHSLTQMSFIYCHLNFYANFLWSWRFPLNILCIMFKIMAFFIITLFARLYVGVAILFTRGKQLHDRVISQRGEVWANKTSLFHHFLLKHLYEASNVSSVLVYNNCICS